MKILFSIFWLLHLHPFTDPSGGPVTTAPPQIVAGNFVEEPENAPPVRSMGTVVEYYEGNGIGKIRPRSSDQTITVLVSDIKGRKKLQLNTEVSYIEVNNRKNGRRASEVDVVNP